MRDIVIGDVHGCYQGLLELLEKVKFTANSDTLWFTGDLVNRGPESANVIRFVKDLGDSAKTILGNHDFHLLSVAHGLRETRKKDFFDDVLEAKDHDTLIEWLSIQPLVQHNKIHDFIMIHAGLSEQWSLKKTIKLGHEVTQAMTDDSHKTLTHLFGDLPNRWNDSLKGNERRCAIVNYLCRARFVNKNGRLNFDQKGSIDLNNDEIYPWFRKLHEDFDSTTIYFGHWSSIGPYKSPRVTCLDSGYYWGGYLTAAVIEADSSITIEQVSNPDTILLL